MAKQIREWQPKPHRAVNYNVNAVQKCIDKHGYVLASPKLDGVRALIKLTSTGLLVTSREGIRIRSLDERLPGMAKELRRLGISMRGAVLDCELYIRGISFDEASGHIRRHSALPLELDVRIGVFDITEPATVTGRQPGRVGLQHRIDYLRSVLLGERSLFEYVPHVACASKWAIETMYAGYRAKGYEGLVLKDPDLPYRNGKVTGWWKLKPDITEDGTVVGYVWGDEAKANANKIVGFEVLLESGETVRATGLTKAQMAEYTDSYEDERDGKIGRYCEVKAMERTASGSLRHPSFKCWRDLDAAKGIKL